jgi:hypothetical protein
VQAPGGHGASSRRAWRKLQEESKLQEGTEKNRGGAVEKKHLLDAQEIPPWHGGAVPAWPRRHQARGSRRRHVGKSPNSRKHQISPRIGPSSSKSRSRSPWPSSRASEVKGMRASGGNRQDLMNMRNRRRLIYRMVTISAADSGGARRNRARRRQGDAVARESAGEKTTRASERVRPVGRTEPPGQVRPGRLAPTGGPGPTSGPSLAEKERERERVRFLIRI